MKRTILLILALMLILSASAFVISCDNGDDVENNDPTYTLPDFEKMTSECKTLDEVILYLTSEGYTADYYLGLPIVNIVNARKIENGYDISIDIALNPIIAFPIVAEPSELDNKIKELYPIDEHELAERKTFEMSGFEICYSVSSVLPSKVVYENALALCATYESAEKIDEHLMQKGYLKTIVTEEDVEVINATDYVANGDRLYIKKESDYLFSVIELYVCSDSALIEEGYITMPFEIVKAKINAVVAHNGASPDSHTYTASETAICGENGCVEDYYTLGTCACGAIEEDIPQNRLTAKAKDAHSLEFVVEKRASCSFDGRGKQTCMLCGYSEDVVLPKDPEAHVYNHSIDVEIEPTCTTDGYGTYHCSVCHKTVTGAIKGEHVYDTCSHEEGDLFPTLGKLAFCDRCGEGTAAVRLVNTNLPAFNVGAFSDGKTLVNIAYGGYNHSFHSVGNVIVISYTVALEHTIRLDGDYTQKDDENGSSNDITNNNGAIILPDDEFE